MSSRNEGRGKISSKNVVKRGKGVFFAEVFENKQKINFKKCPIYPMLCDIIVLLS
jgi:hypothetical protein